MAYIESVLIKPINLCGNAFFLREEGLRTAVEWIYFGFYFIGWIIWLWSIIAIDLMKLRWVSGRLQRNKHVAQYQFYYLNEIYSWIIDFTFFFLLFLLSLNSLELQFVCKCDQIKNICLWYSFKWFFFLLHWISNNSEMTWIHWQCTHWLCVHNLDVISAIRTRDGKFRTFNEKIECEQQKMFQESEIVVNWCAANNFIYYSKISIGVCLLNHLLLTEYIKVDGWICKHLLWMIATSTFSLIVLLLSYTK